MSTLSVAEVDVMREAVWQYRDSTPRWSHRRYGTSAPFDPFPAYPHDLDTVRQAAARVVGCLPPIWDVELYSADREETGRSNGFSSLHQWGDEPNVGLIVLSGKRVPPHPAMTRYLVAHEYGHHVEWMLQHLEGHGGNKMHDDHIVTEYARMRGLLLPLHAGSGGRWHDSAVEVFACDFRIMVCGVEPEFWPHPGVPRPEEVTRVDDWWTEIVTGWPAAGTTAAVAG